MEDSPLQVQQDLLRQLLPGWSLRLALQAVLLLEVVLPRQVLLAAEVAAPEPSSLQAVAAPARGSWQAAAALRPPDSSAPEQPDSYHRLPAALVPEAELARAKPTPTRL